MFTVNDVFNDAMLYFPSLKNDVNTYEMKGPQILKLVLNDGTEYHFNYSNKTMRRITDYDGTEVSWQKQFSYRLSEAMSNRGLNQAGLAELSGVSQGTISLYITLKAKPSGYNIQKLAKALDCPIRELIDF